MIVPQPAAPAMPPSPSPPGDFALAYLALTAGFVAVALVAWKAGAVRRSAAVAIYLAGAALFLIVRSGFRLAPALEAVMVVYAVVLAVGAAFGRRST